MKSAILVLYMGGPSTLKEIKPFLTRLFSDKNILDFRVPQSLQNIAAHIIANMRFPKIKKQYMAIGGGSPLVKYSIEQAEAIERLTGIKTFVGMLYSQPLLKDTVNKIMNFNPDKIAIITLYPQYSTATVKACIEKAESFLKDFKVSSVKSWCRNKHYINWIKKQLLCQLKKCKEPHILFSAHSLPEYIVKRGDIYVEEIEDTVKLVMENIDTPHTISYQSKVGPIKWIGPSTGEVIVKLANSGVKELVIFPISFVSEHIETLYEIDVEYRKLSLESGIEKFVRVKLNHLDEELIKAMFEEVKGAINRL